MLKEELSVWLTKIDRNEVEELKRHTPVIKR